MQTNEVRRCTYLYPVFCYIYSKSKRPLALMEIGTSAGLQLLWDKYSYSYGDGKKYGNKDSALQLQTDIRNGYPSVLLAESPPVASRLGVDLHICDVMNQDEYMWLRALIWPEHSKRVELLSKAVDEFKKHPPELIEGDGIKLLPELVEQTSEENTLCIFHTHVANQMPKEQKEELLDKIAEIGRNRNVFHIYNNIWDGKLHLDYFIDGVESSEIIGETDGHAKWFTWNLE